MADDAGEKTEEATSHHLEQARSEGNVAKSRELTAGLALLVTALFLYFYMPYIVEVSRDAFRYFFQTGKYNLDYQSVRIAFFYCLAVIGKLVMPLLVLLFVITFLAEAGQVGLRISTKAIEPKWERINFFMGLPKFLSLKKKGVELIKSLFKIIILGYVGMAVLSSRMNDIMRSMDSDYIDSHILMGSVLFEIVFKISIVVIFLGLLDLLYQKWNRKQELKMTKQQIKEEYKQMEGDPQIKHKIREAQREMARKRMMDDVPKSDVVVTNPVHFAVALKYAGGSAPVVTAKGQRLMALKIKDLARENNIYIHEDPPLARLLYKTLEIGDEIPENLYKAIAEILAIVYRIRDEK